MWRLVGLLTAFGDSGPHHGHYVAIVKGPHSWLMFDDDKIEPIKESEIPRYFGDAASGSAYVLYYQAVDLDPALLGIKVPAEPTVPDVTVASSPASATNASMTNEMPSLELSEPALPPGLGEPPAHSPAVAPTSYPHPPIPHPPIPTAPSSPSLVTSPLGGPVTPLSRKKSLPSIRIPGISEATATSPTTPNRTHGGGLFQTLRSSPSSSKIRPSTAEGLVSTRSASEDVPPVPLVPLRYMNGKEAKDKEKDKDKEREEERSSKEFDRRPSLWFKLRSGKPTKDDREKEKEKEKDAKGKEKDAGSAPAPAAAATPSSHATPSATALAAVPSQSDAPSSVSGASSLWRRGSARVGYHVKRLSATHSTTTLGEMDTAAGPLASSSSSSHPHPHHHHHHHHHHRHHNHHHHQQEPPGQPPAVPATPQNLHPDPAPSSPSSSSSSPVLVSAEHRPPPLAGVDGLLPPGLGAEAYGGIPDSPTLPAWRVSPASPPIAPSGSIPPTTALPRHTRGPTSIGDDNDDDDNDRDSDSSDDDRDHLRARVTFLAGRLRGRRPHSVHGSGSGTPRERSTSPHEEAPSPQSIASPAGPAEPGGGGASSSSASATSSSAVAKGKEPVGLRRAARKLSLNAHLFGIGLGLGLGGRDRERDHHHHQHQDQQQQQQQQQQHHHLSKKEDGKKANKTRPTSGLFGLGGSSAALASAGTVP